MIKSKFSISIYVGIFITLLFLAIPFFFIWKTQRTGQSDERYLRLLILPCFSIILFAAYSRLLYFFTITTERIIIKGVFKQKNIAFADIRLIDLFSKESLYWTTGGDAISIRIEMENGEKVILPDTFYRNSHKVKKFILDNFKDKIKPYINDRHTVLSGTALETDPEKFAGNPYISFRGVLIYCLLITTLLFTITASPSKRWDYLLIFSIMTLLFSVGLGSQLYYFLLTDKKIIVKHHVFLWVKKVYNIGDIAEINFEKGYRAANGLRISTHDFKSKLYRAGSLSDQTWQRLKEKLQSLGIYFAD